MPRGRKPGSKNKPKIEPFNPSKLQEEFEAVDASSKSKLPDPIEHLLGVIDAAAAFTSGHAKLHTLHADGSKTEIIYPDNWNTMDKTEKLRWLTEHRR